VTRAAALLFVAALACGRSQGTPDEDLGSLVLAPKVVAAAIDVGKAATDPGELGRALGRPYRETVAVLGPHTVTVATTTTTSSGDTVVDDRSDKATLELGAGPAFHGTYENSSDYGRETIFVDKTLYLRPRYQRWHARLPEATDEPATLRDGFADAMGATWDLLAPGAELVDKGATTFAGRPGRMIEVRLAPHPATTPGESLTQKKWRINRTVTAVAGQIVLDAAKGVPLAVELTGTVGFARDGHPMTMKLSVKSTVDKLGQPATITVPAPAEVVATPERAREVDDRDLLLEGIAPPAAINKPKDPP
jgi:hypothetical protein